jgi:hypothetical protein
LSRGCSGSPSLARSDAHGGRARQSQSTPDTPKRRKAGPLPAC